MGFDYSKLKGRIIEVYGSQQRFAIAMGLSERSMSLKMQNKVGWKQPEINKACALLEIDINELHEYFFKLKVQGV